ncbi:helix-turn-helix domain-containing protein [Paenibacillus oryzisoli]|uniref:helix-turn-helix domain-containing protein n=1 Tax=Paenibacillus oryzisoli TaxID=1850517 RepID=UPI003D2D218F
MKPTKQDVPSIIRERGETSVIAGHFHEFEGYSTRRPHGMSDWLMTFTLEGSGYFLIGGEERFCHAGDVTLMRPGVSHEYGTRKNGGSGEWHFLWVHFTDRVAETSLLPETELLIHAVEHASLRSRIQRAFTSIVSDSVERAPYWQELSENALREVILLLAQRLTTQSDPRIEEVKHLLALRMREQVSVEALARAVGLSASRLAHVYKASTGMSIIDSLNEMRIRQAAILLAHTDRLATEVAVDVGFQNYNHFAAQFKRRYGMSPRAYKEMGVGN